MSSARSPRSRRPAPPGRGQFTVRPAAVVVILVVLGLFIAGMAIGGIVGGAMIGVLAVAAGVLLVLRWQAVDPQIRIFRLVAVLVALAVAVTVMVRG